MYKKIFIIAFILLAYLITVMLSPLIARIGSSTTLKTWSCQAKDTSLNRILYLSVNENVAWVDIWRLYPTYRIMITDGGYFYVAQVSIHSDNPKEYVSRSDVVWREKEVELDFESGEKIIIPVESFNLGSVK